MLPGIIAGNSPWARVMLRADLARVMLRADLGHVELRQVAQQVGRFDTPVFVFVLGFLIAVLELLLRFSIV